MSILDFVASLVGSIAWPTAVVVMIWLFRKQLAGLLPLLRRLRYRDLELEFAEAVADLNEKIGELPQPPTASMDRRLDRLTVIAGASPRAAITEAWLEVEAAAIQLATAKAVLPRREPRFSPAKVGRALFEAQLITSAELSFFDELRIARNRVAHGEELDLKDSLVRDYISAALTLADYLRTKAKQD